MGTVLGSVMGSNLSLHDSSLIFFGPCVFLIILLAFLPDSSHYLVKLKDLDAARKSIKWYRGDQQVEEEIQEVIKFVRFTDSENFMDKLGNLS